MSKFYFEKEFIFKTFFYISKFQITNILFIFITFNRTKPLAKYSSQNLVLRLPEGKTLRDLTYISVWCKKVAANFGHLELKHVKNLTIPTAIEIRPLSQIEHGVKSGPINVIDAQTFLITDFHYDGEGPAGYWWASKGDKQNPQGAKIADENGKLKKLLDSHFFHLFYFFHKDHLNP